MMEDDECGFEAVSPGLLGDAVLRARIDHYVRTKTPERKKDGRKEGKSQTEVVTCIGLVLSY